MGFRPTLFFALIVVISVTFYANFVSAGECGDVNRDGKVNIADLVLGMQVVEGLGEDPTCPASYVTRLDIGPLLRDDSGDLLPDGGPAQPDPDGMCDSLDLQVIEQIILNKIELNCTP